MERPGSAVQRISIGAVDDADAGSWKKASRYQWRDDVESATFPHVRWWLTFNSTPAIDVQPRRGARLLNGFADLGSNRSPMRTAIRRYATTVGHLGDPHTVRTPEGAELLGEALELWETEIDLVGGFLDLLGEVRGLPLPGPRQDLLDRLSIEAGSVTVEFARNHHITLTGDVAASAQRAVGDDAVLSRLVKYAAGVHLTRLLKERLSVGFALDPPRLNPFPATLRSALHFELLRELVGGRAVSPQKQCPLCHEMFQPRTRSQIYCTSQHQQLWNYRHNDRKRGRKR